MTNFSSGTSIASADINTNFDNLEFGYSYQLTPTIPSAWTTDPTNLTNITDNDDTTVTGTGVIAGTATKYILIDIGWLRVFSRVHYKIGLWVDVNGTGTSLCQIEASPDNSTWTSLGDVNADITDTSEVVAEGSFDASGKRYRYFRILFTAHTDDTNLNAKIYSLDVI